MAMSYPYRDGKQRKISFHRSLWRGFKNGVFKTIRFSGRCLPWSLWGIVTLISVMILWGLGAGIIGYSKAHDKSQSEERKNIRESALIIKELDIAEGKVCIEKIEKLTAANQQTELGHNLTMADLMTKNVKLTARLDAADVACQDIAFRGTAHWKMSAFVCPHRKHKLSVVDNVMLCSCVPEKDD